MIIVIKNLYFCQIIGMIVQETYFSWGSWNSKTENFKIKNYSEKAADILASLRAKLAAIALANHMVLVTRNTKHFAAIQEVSELQVENWFES